MQILVQLAGIPREVLQAENDFDCKVSIFGDAGVFAP
jgi:hypothetical protein